MHKQAIGFAAAAVVSWVAFLLLMRAAVLVWPVSLAGTYSRALSAAILLLWVVTRGSGSRRLRPRGTAGWLTLMGIVAIGINLLCFSALKWTTATNVSLLVRLDLVFVVLIGAIFRLERVGLVPLLVLLPVMLAGLALLVEIDRIEWGGHALGDLMIVASALGLAINAFVIRHIMQQMDEEAVAAINQGATLLGFIAMGLITGDFTSPPEAAGRLSAWLLIVALAVASAVSLPLYYAALRRMKIWTLRAFMLSGPVLVLAVEWWLWNVRLTTSQCAGAVLMLLALALLVRIELRPGESQLPAGTPE
ncbi:MAG: DMT family transporter [Planctomycetes bacterium]|nr:DMT family transporter [Planctomycetota bacterium]